MQVQARNDCLQRSIYYGTEIHESLVELDKVGWFTLTDQKQEK